MRRACASREYCVADILKKLQRYKLSNEENTKIISSLKEDRFIDELRYAEAFVKDKSRLSGWGRTKILWVLRSKHIDREIIEKAVSILSEDDTRKQLHKILAAKLRISPFGSGLSGESTVTDRDPESTDPETNSYAEPENAPPAEFWNLREKQKAKLVRFGLSRGFEYNMVLSVVNEILENSTK